MTNNKTRVISAQGPTQLINILAILSYQVDSETVEVWQDHLVLGGFCTETSSETTKIMIESCIKISKYWNFESVKYLSDRDLSDASFSEAVERVKQKLCLKNVNSVYVCRDWQLFNEILLETYKNSRKICYGDGFGMLSLNGNDNKWQPTPCNPEGYRKIDSAYLFVPSCYDDTSFDLVGDIVQPPIDYLISTINNISLNIPEIEIYAKLLNNNLNKKLTLVTTSNLTESCSIKNKFNFSPISLKYLLVRILRRLLLALNRRFSLFQINTLERTINFLSQEMKRISDVQKSRLEVSMYVEQINRYTDNNETIIVKPHPRETLAQSLQLVDRLSKEGYEAIVIDRYLSCFSIELFFHYLKFSKVISLGSSSSLTAILLLNIDDKKIFPFIDIDIEKKYLDDLYYAGNEKNRLFWIDILDQAKRKSFSPLKFTDY